MPSEKKPTTIPTSCVAQIGSRRIKTEKITVKTGIVLNKSAASPELTYCSPALISRYGSAK